MAVDSLRAEGFSTIIRLPLNDDVDPDIVAEHLVRNLNAQLLLFLPSIDHLELQGTSHDFRADAVRDTSGDIEHVYMDTDEGTEEWFVYRGVTAPPTEALAALGEEWSELAEAKFAVAVPLESGESATRPRIDETYPLHVYFPTEEEPGFRVAVHAEWVLTMDRRRISDTPEATAYNDHLLGAVAEFIGSTVARDLVQRCDLSVESIRAVIPEDVGHLTGAAKAIAEHWRDSLAAVAFLPLATDDCLGRPGEVRLFPQTIPDHAWAQRLSLVDGTSTLRCDVEADWDVRRFVHEVNNECEMTDAEFLENLAQPMSDDAVEFYGFLLAWREHNWHLPDDLKKIACVFAANGQLLVPSQQTIYFPRRDESLPDDLPVPIAQLYDIEGMDNLLRDLGVRNFEWRDLINGYLIKILEREDADPHERERAMSGLRAYQKARRDTTEVGLAVLGRVLVPARDWGATSVRLRPAAEVYFGEEWTGTTDLEQLYGPFGEYEFLAVEVPVEPDGVRDDSSFYRMLGVSDHPRLTRVTGNHVLDSSTHPHRTINVVLFNRWLDAVVARRCPMNHDSQHQRLTLSSRLDRLEDLIDSGDPRRLFLLWNQLAQHWGSSYEQGLLSTVRCSHRYHSIDPERTVDSLFAYTLRSRAWVPVELDDEPQIVRPSDAWFESSELPLMIRARIPRISASMYRKRGGVALAAELDLVDASYPGTDNLLKLLESIATEADRAGTPYREIERAARWVQRTIEDSLGPEERPHSAPQNVRVLAMHRGKSLFANQPPFADDPLLRDTWQHHMPILLADNDSGKLHKYLGLARLDDEISVTAEPLNIQQGELRHHLMRRIDDAKPYIVALIAAENARLESRSIKSMRNLEVVLCDRLVLRYRYKESEVERTDARCHIARFDTTDDDKRSRSVGRAYVELDSSTSQPDWFAVGGQLAQYLGVSTHADAITMLLSISPAERDRMMVNRQISEDAVLEARTTLVLAHDTDHSPASVLDAYLASNNQREVPAGVDHADGTVRSSAGELREGTEPIVKESITQGLSAGMHLDSGDTEPPPVDYSSVSVVDAQPIAVGSGRHAVRGRATSFSIGAISSAPSIQNEAQKRLAGKRGEEVAFNIERARVQSMDLDPGQVIWQSKDDELAPFDILSIDQDGSQIFIEVKSTVGSDPSDPFYISGAELLEASFHRNRYYIHRVTDVNTATPSITRWCNPIELIKNEQGRLLLSTAQMELGVLASLPDSNA
ncbi:hypothetical protein CRM90_26505 [Mycobacterium sp. ENV421]|uniref:DUF3883 domain-containing protein n=1 Tax=Mycobacterium sp. ENV421 TaxID=1213407 RepID=UPI000C9A4369|nr:DUF3883 domain-containing protein [Mycobacterium sp. ENV421]PND54720.1 hypothetical protein CRM90_26505 [Mycobacterium sp. ENV421]